MTCAALKSRAMRSAASTATIAEPAIATEPGVRTRRGPSIVTTMPLATMRSTARGACAASGTATSAAAIASQRQPVCFRSRILSFCIGESLLCG